MTGTMRRVAAALATTALLMMMMMMTLLVSAAPATAWLGEPVAPVAPVPPTIDERAAVPDTSTTTTAAPLDAPDPRGAATSQAAPDVGAAASPIAGWVADGDSGTPLGGICVAFYSVEDKDAFAGWTVTSGDGEWSFTPAVDGAYRIASYRPKIDGDCTSMPMESGPVPEWAFDHVLSPSEPTAAVPPPSAAVIPSGSSRLGVCLGDTRMHVGGCDRRFGGAGEISGRVIQPGQRPLAAACIFVLADVAGETQGYGAMTDSAGRYVVGGLPEDLTFYVAAVPPFAGGGGPCESDDGPPPVAGPGQLQAEFYADVWIDLSSPDLDSNPAGWAAARGATPVVAGATGVDLCLTTDVGETAQRGPCTEPATAPSGAAPEAVAAEAAALDAAAPVHTTLPLTGGSPAVLAATGTALVALGVSALVLTRRRANLVRNIS
jgi:hypothetical protein